MIKSQRWKRLYLCLMCLPSDRTNSFKQDLCAPNSVSCIYFEKNLNLNELTVLIFGFILTHSFRVKKDTETIMKPHPIGTSP